jgi:hypothetical protein
MLLEHDTVEQEKVRTILRDKSLEDLEKEKPLVYGILVTQRKRAE